MVYDVLDYEWDPGEFEATYYHVQWAPQLEYYPLPGRTDHRRSRMFAVKMLEGARDCPVNWEPVWL